MDSIYIIVLNWNRKEDTLACLKSISEIKSKEFELTTVVVDNGSTDDSFETVNSFILKKHNFVQIKSEINLGFAKGNNFGIEYALKKKADYVVLLNNDAVVDKNFVKYLYDFAKDSEVAGILSPKIYFAKGFEFHKDYKSQELGKVIWASGGDIDWNNMYATNHGVDEVDVGQYDHFREIEFASGACLFIKADLLRRLGGFDEKYYLYFEDVDLCLRCKKLGYKICYIPESVIWHKVSQSSKIGGNLNDYFITRNRLLFGMKYAGIRTRFALYRESLKLYLTGRGWQKRGVIDFYFKIFGKGSWK